MFTIMISARKRAPLLYAENMHIGLQAQRVKKIEKIFWERPLAVPNASLQLREPRSHQLESDGIALLPLFFGNIENNDARNAVNAAWDIGRIRPNELLLATRCEAPETPPARP